MRERFQPRQTEEAASTFDGVNETEDIGENVVVVRLLLEPDKLDVDDVEALVGLGEKVAQQVVHNRIEKVNTSRGARSRVRDHAASTRESGAGWVKFA